MRTKRRRWWLAFALLFGGAACGGEEASSPDICDEACKAWDACVGEADWYPYETCVADCRRDGDWDRGYVECLEERSTCSDMEADCG